MRRGAWRYLVRNRGGKSRVATEGERAVGRNRSRPERWLSRLVAAGHPTANLNETKSQQDGFTLRAVGILSRIGDEKVSRSCTDCTASGPVGVLADTES